MKRAFILFAMILTMALPGGAFAAAKAPYCSNAAGSLNPLATPPRGKLANRIERADVREAESAKEWNSYFPSLGFYYGRMAPCNALLLGQRTDLNRNHSIR